MGIKIKDKEINKIRIIGMDVVVCSTIKKRYQVNMDAEENIGNSGENNRKEKNTSNRSGEKGVIKIYDRKGEIVTN